MNPILAAIAADQNIDAAFRASIAPPTFYRARYGRCRQYLSASDAALYDTGWSSWPEMPEGSLTAGGPAFDGYFDREDHEADKEDARRERFERENDWGDDEELA